MQLPIHFSSRIQIVSKEDMLALEKKTPSERHINSPWTYKQRLSAVVDGFSSKASVCNMGGVQDRGELNMYHLIPAEIFNPWKDAAAALEEDFKRLKNPEQARGLIVGGQDISNTSRNLKDVLIGLYQRWGIPFSLLWGQTPGSDCQAHYAVDTDTWTIELNVRTPRQNVLLPGVSVSDLPSLHASLEEIRIEDGDQLYIGDKKIASQSANKPGRKAKEIARLPLDYLNYD